MHNPNIYLESLNFKLESAKYHHDSVIKSLNNEPYTLYLLGSKKEEAILAASSEFIAMMLSLHSCLDVLAQWINSKSIGMNESDVTFKKITSRTSDPVLRDKLNRLHSSSNYLIDFCNIIKHRHIIKFYKEESMATMAYLEYLRIDEFTRNNKEYESYPLIDLMSQIYNTITNQIHATIEYCEEIFKSMNDT